MFNESYMLHGSRELFTPSTPILIFNLILIICCFIHLRLSFIQARNINNKWCSYSVNSIQSNKLECKISKWICCILPASNYDRSWKVCILCLQMLVLESLPWWRVLGGKTENWTFMTDLWWRGNVCHDVTNCHAVAIMWLCGRHNKERSNITR